MINPQSRSLEWITETTKYGFQQNNRTTILSPPYFSNPIR